MADNPDKHKIGAGEGGGGAKEIFQIVIHFFAWMSLYKKYFVTRGLKMPLHNCSGFRWFSNIGNQTIQTNV